MQPNSSKVVFWIFASVLFTLFSVILVILLLALFDILTPEMLSTANLAILLCLLLFAAIVVLTIMFTNLPDHIEQKCCRSRNTDN